MCLFRFLLCVLSEYLYFKTYLLNKCTMCEFLCVCFMQYLGLWFGAKLFFFFFFVATTVVVFTTVSSIGKDRFTADSSTWLPTRHDRSLS